MAQGAISPAPLQQTTAHCNYGRDPPLNPKPKPQTVHPKPQTPNPKDRDLLRSSRQAATAEIVPALCPAVMRVSIAHLRSLDLGLKKIAALVTSGC